MIEFTEERIKHLTKKHNWELVPTDNGRYLLRQKDQRYMKTVDFDLPEEIAKKFLDA